MLASASPVMWRLLEKVQGGVMAESWIEDVAVALESIWLPVSRTALSCEPGVCG